jgi:squalene synthase HpnC
VEEVPMATATRTRPARLPTDSEILGRVGRENFTVASRLLPRAARRHLLAFYGYARLIDQLGDAYDGDRLAALDWAQAELEAALSDPDAPGLHPLIAAAAASARTLGLDATPFPSSPFVRLIDANRMDQRTTRYATWDDLIGYCRLSADPIGHLVLAAFDADTPTRRQLSDRICSALQVAEHLQDVAEDAASGRVYLPADDLARFGVDPAELAGLARPTTALRAAVAYEAQRTRALLDDGAPLVTELRGTARFAVAGFVAGGYATLDAIGDGGFDPITATPRPAATRVVAHLARLLRKGAAA